MNILPNAILENIAIKNVKTDFGHDMNGFFCDIFFKGKKIGYLNNDGWGAPPEIRSYTLEKNVFEPLEKFLNEQNFAQFQADEYNKSDNLVTKDWSATDFDFDSQVDFICERLAYLKEFQRQQKNAIIFGKPFAQTYGHIRFKLSLDELKQKYPEAFKAKVLEIKNNLKEGECIFNTNLQEFL